MRERERERERDRCTIRDSLRRVGVREIEREREMHTKRQFETD